MLRSTPIKPRTVLIGACVVVLTAACSGGPTSAEDFPPISTEESVTTASTSSSTSITTTTAPPESTRADTEETATNKPDLEIPTEWPSELDEIFGRYQLYWDALDIAYGPPEADPDFPPLQELTSTKAYEELRARLKDNRDEGTVIAYPEDSISDHIVRLPNPVPLDKTEGNEVIIQDCWVDDAQFLNRTGDLIRSVYESSLSNVTMKVIDGEWRVLAVVEASEQSSGYQECKEYINQL